MVRKFSPETQSNIVRLFGREKLDLPQLKAANSDITLILMQLSPALNKLGVDTFLDIGSPETIKLKKHINTLCNDTDEARDILRLHLLLINLEDKSSKKTSYDKEKIKALFKELAMRPNGQFQKNLTSIATRKIFELTHFDKAGARQFAINMLAEIAEIKRLKP
jgi:hypothetical protein